jgi:aspartyl-tRNA(Asn)/glutamyl-tRNA(Gln) amidotransferase subunit A
MPTSLEFSTIQEIADQLKKKTLSPVELTNYYLDRIQSLNPKLNAYIAVMADRAQATAQAAETAITAGHYLGPLHGIPLGIKDLVDIAGMPTTSGSILFKNKMAQTDATITRKLAQAGAIFLGKTHLVEFAFGGVGINHHYGTPHNPWDAHTQRIPGGSSSGSAVAVAADLAPAAIGSDTGGSVRIPASFCGLFGLKPTFGRISSAGLLSLDSGLDSVGPLTRSAHDAALIYQLLAGPDPADRTTWNQPCDSAFAEMQHPIAGLRLVIPQEYFWDDVDPQTAQAVRAAADQFATLGAHVEQRSFKELDELSALRARGSLTAVEAYIAFKQHLENTPELFDPIVRSRIEDGRTMTATDYLAAQRGYIELRHRFHKIMEDFDALLTPTTPFAALPVAEADQEAHYSRINGLCLRNTAAVNLLGLCATSQPCGFTADGLPIGLQLIGRPFAEARILRLARAYETATQWHTQTPPLQDFS